MFSNFFIKRPIFAIVVSLVIVISGLISMFQLPIEQYPNMAPVQIMSQLLIRAQMPRQLLKRWLLRLKHRSTVSIT